MIRFLRGRLVFVVLSAWLVLSASFAAHADDIAIFDVRKSLPMDPREPTFKDYYLNAGEDAGVRKGMYVSVVRTLPIYDPFQNKPQDDLTIEVAKLHVIHVEKNMSVGRLVHGFDASDRPLVEFEAIMVGDRLRMTTATMDAPKPPRPGARQPNTETAAGSLPTEPAMNPVPPPSPLAPPPSPAVQTQPPAPLLMPEQPDPPILPVLLSPSHFVDMELPPTTPEPVGVVTIAPIGSSYDAALELSAAAGVQVVQTVTEAPMQVVRGEPSF